MIDHRLIRALHVERLRREDLGAETREPHSIFQTSTLDALLGGAYDGDVTFADLALRGDLGLGTLDGLDGEMIALDGAFYRAGTDGSVRPPAPDAPPALSAVLAGRRPSGRVRPRPSLRHARRVPFPRLRPRPQRPRLPPPRDLGRPIPRRSRPRLPGPRRADPCRPLLAAAHGAPGRRGLDRARHVGREA